MRAELLPGTTSKAHQTASPQVWVPSGQSWGWAGVGWGAAAYLCVSHELKFITAACDLLLD